MALPESGGGLPAPWLVRICIAVPAAVYVIYDVYAIVRARIHKHVLVPAVMTGCTLPAAWYTTQKYDVIMHVRDANPVQPSR